MASGESVSDTIPAPGLASPQMVSGGAVFDYSPARGSNRFDLLQVDDYVIDSDADFEFDSESDGEQDSDFFGDPDDPPVSPDGYPSDFFEQSDDDAPELLDSDNDSDSESDFDDEAKHATDESDAEHEDEGWRDFGLRERPNWWHYHEERRIAASNAVAANLPPADDELAAAQAADDPALPQPAENPYDA